jgi:Raf kinase inhibitor-like YbhB/YbcL family protein
MTPLRALLVLSLVAVTTSCSHERPTATDGGVAADTGTPVPDGGSPPDTGTPDTGPVAFELTSSAFAAGEMVPLTHECGPPLSTGPGDNVSPPLAWTSGPPATMSYAIVMRDTDAGNLVHWVIYDIPATVFDLPEDIPDGYEPATPAGAKQAELQGSGYFGYFGPCSPGSINTYVWTVHALDTPTLSGVSASSTEDQIAAAVEGASIASASLAGES